MATDRDISGDELVERVTISLVTFGSPYPGLAYDVRREPKQAPPRNPKPKREGGAR